MGLFRNSNLNFYTFTVFVSLVLDELNRPMYKRRPQYNTHHMCPTNLYSLTLTTYKYSSISTMSTLATLPCGIIYYVMHIYYSRTCLIFNEIKLNLGLLSIF